MGEQDISRDGEASKAIVQRWYNASVSGRLDEAWSLVAVDVRYWVLGVGERDFWSVKAFFDGAYGAAPGPDAMRIISMTAEGERVSVEAQGNLPMVDGRRYANDYHMLFTVRDGQIVSIREYLDTARIEAFFGVSLEQAAVQSGMAQARAPEESDGSMGA